MAGPSDLFDAIKAYAPSGWDWDTGTPNIWINAVCTGFVNMWTAGTTAVGLPTYTGTPPWPHTHLILLMPPTPMISELAGLGYSPEANAFFTGISTAISTTLIGSSLTSLDPDGTISHSHILPGPPFATFGTASALKSAMLGSIVVTGSGVDPILEAFSKGIIDFLTANAGLSAGAGPTHTHGLTV